MRGLLIFILLALPLNSRAADSPSGAGDAKTNQPLAPSALDSPAQAAIRKLTTPDAGTRPLRIAKAEKNHPDLVTRLDEIRVYGRNEPEDYVGRKPSPLMQFRGQLEKDVPLSPAKKVQIALCLIGLCAIYGPEGIPLGDSPEVRADARLTRSTTQLNGQFYGTLQ